MFLEPDLQLILWPTLILDKYISYAVSLKEFMVIETSVVVYLNTCYLPQPLDCFPHRFPCIGVLVCIDE